MNAGIAIARRARTAVALGIRAAVGTFALLTVPVFVSAHHSSSMFDDSRSLTLQGVVQEFRWTNPHVFIQMLVKGGEEQREGEWSVEMDSPDRLARAGWRPDVLGIGDTVTLVVHPRRDNANGGRYVSGAGPRGALIEDLPPAPLSARTLSPEAANPSCPRVELTRVEPSASPETRPVNLGERVIFVRRDAITSTSDITEIKVAGDDADTLIQIKYKPDAATRLLDATTNHDGVNLAFVVDNDVWLAFTWRGPYGIGPDGTQLSIQHGLARAESLLESVRRCTGAPVR